MFSFKSKIDSTLRDYISKNPNNTFRVLIKCKTLQDNIAKKIQNYRCELIRSIPKCNLLSALMNSSHILRLIEYPEVEYICLDEYGFLCGASLCTSNKVHIPKNFDKKGTGIGIGIVDSGVYPHPDLIGPKNRIALFTDIINKFNYPYDDNGHGTAICGLIAGNGSASNGIYTGIAPNSSLYCFKAFDRLGKGYASDILFAISNLIDISYENNIKVFCLPFEFHYPNSLILKSFDILFDICISNNITPIVPAGSNRDWDGSITGIALSSKCLTIGGVNYEYSSCGESKKSHKPNFSAYCKDIVSLNCNSNFISEKNDIRQYPPKLKTSYNTFSGTSLAAAYITGLVTLLYEGNPSLSFKDVSSLLKLSTTPVDDIKHSKQGEGIISFNKLFDINYNKK